MNELIALFRVATCEPEPTCGWQARLSCPSGSHPCRWNASASALPSLPLCLSIYPQLVSRYHILRNCPVTVESIWEAVGSISRYVAFNCIHSLPCSVRRASIRISTAQVTEQATGCWASGYPLTRLAGPTTAKARFLDREVRDQGIRRSQRSGVQRTRGAGRWRFRHELTQIFRS